MLNHAVPANDQPQAVPFGLNIPAIDSVVRTEAPGSARVGVTVLTIDGEERAGRLMDICDDLETAKVITVPAPQAGEAVVFYLDSGMRFVATCMEVTDGVAHLRLKLSHHRKIRRTQDLGARPLRQDTDRRDVDDACLMRDADGNEHDCRVMDISLTGLYVATDAKLAEGEIVRVGKAAAEVVRKGPGGYGLRLIKVGTRPVPNPDAKRRADRFAAALAPQAISA